MLCVDLTKNNACSARHQRERHLQRRQVFALSLLLALFVPGFFLSMACAPLPSNESIDPEKNKALLEEVWSGFHPDHRTYLQEIPLLLQPGTRTALAHTEAYVTMPYDYAYIAVSTDWDHTAEESPYWDALRERGDAPTDPVFADSFKKELLGHEYLHMLQQDLGIDVAEVAQLVREWYPDPQYGVPDAADSRIKYILWWNLFKTEGATELEPTWRQMQYQGQYGQSTPGVEEFAYIGSQILIESTAQGRQARLQELSPALREVYEGILDPQLLTLEE